MRMGKDRCLFIIVVLLLWGTGFALAACSDDSTSGSGEIGDPCETAADCIEGLECIQEICVISDAVDGDMEAEEQEDAGESDFEPSDPELTWVYIEGGTFDMGCSAGDDQCFPKEEDMHTEQVDSFKITATEITRAQYAAVTGEYPGEFTDCPDCPVESVNYFEAGRYCHLVGGYLPRGKQWEYAARAGTTTRYYCGDSQSCVDDIAWYRDNSDGHPHPVGLKTPNAWGLYDMLGNVDEWVQDEFRPEYVYPGTEGITYYIRRGGNWDYGDLSVKASSIIEAPDERRANTTGFRCVKWAQ